ncbi:STAS/SEC14 domain-containing protein [Xanthomarina sp. F1114]|uniref:STAS/SEC14 domain-containing protein n=1 Tax=Xanthomarina sp. F1114 TaxID=2996019 RepID=UPI00225E68A1|nr:STAS/SEC14 domain-containing protein [Xanthomarina sp. F1114]MCX7548216.1 STAS/SEC14 domain-containing protein [Xanthomarina sp. F1114]
MKIITVPYGKIIVLQEQIAEVIINRGVVMDEEMIGHYHDLLRSKLKAPFYLIINKKNAYTYNFLAQRNLATIKEIAAMAVVAYNQTTSMATDMLDKLPRKEAWNLRIFSDREEALQWILYEQEKNNNLNPNK